MVPETEAFFLLDEDLRNWLMEEVPDEFNPGFRTPRYRYVAIANVFIVQQCRAMRELASAIKTISEKL